MTGSGGPPPRGATMTAGGASLAAPRQPRGDGGTSRQAQRRAARQPRLGGQPAAVRVTITLVTDVVPKNTRLPSFISGIRTWPSAPRAHSVKGRTTSQKPIRTLLCTCGSKRRRRHAGTAQRWRRAENCWRYAGNAGPALLSSSKPRLSLRTPTSFSLGTPCRLLLLTFVPGAFITTSLMAAPRPSSQGHVRALSSSIWHHERPTKAAIPPRNRQLCQLHHPWCPAIRKDSACRTLPLIEQL